MIRIDNRTNEERSEYCKGCAWPHIGVKVDHNHCDYVGTNETISNEFDRVNGKITYINNKLVSHSETCRWFWDEEKDANPNKQGIYYKSPISDKCPKIPTIKNH